MTHDAHRSDRPVSTPAPEGRKFKPYSWAVLALAVTGLVIYLVTDHWTHLLAALPYVAIIAFTAMHLFMHKGHNHGGHNPGGHNHDDPTPGGHDQGATDEGRAR